MLNAAALLGLFAFAVPAARADYAVLRSGQRLHITGWELIGDNVRIDIAGGSLTVPATELVGIEPEEVFVPNPAQPAIRLDVPYADQIRASASTHGVDPLLVASVISAESNFNPRAVSPKAAFGLMQLRRATAAHLSVRNIFDPQQNIDAGTRYLRELLDRFDQNISLALAAYNAGPERVAQYRGIPPFAETQNYIRRVNANLLKHKAADTALAGSLLNRVPALTAIIPAPASGDSKRLN